MTADTVSPRHAAKVLGVDIQTVWRWCRERRIGVTRDCTGHYHIERCEVESIRDNPDGWCDRLRGNE